MSYKPLPDVVTIKNSGIHGLGLFATADISQGTVLGKIYFDHNGRTERTPLGGFGNHSDEPNCTKILMEDGSWWITTNQDVKSGDELTWAYTMYNVT